MAGNGFDGLLSVHTEALKHNSDEISGILKVLSEKSDKLTPSELNTLKSINKEIKALDKSLDDKFGGGDDYGF
jgi:hypothetical protein